MQYKKSDFYYNLPEELIAQTPIEPRDCSRLLVYDRSDGRTEHRIFKDVINYLEDGDVLVVNNTKVLPARLFAKTENGGTVEVLLLKRINADEWEVLVKPGRKCSVGKKLTVSEELSLTVTGITETGERTVRFEYNGVFEEILDKLGSMPLPPYIKAKLRDKNRYQTVYAKVEGSAAAPTAGLHFTPELLEKIKKKGVKVAEVLLHVGLGTFRPVKEEDILKHNMHSEYCEIDKANAEIINNAVKDGRRVICVGTTSVRTVESLADENGFVKADKMDTNIFIYPGYKFKVVKGLITNFHLPESTLIMLVSAFMGRENTLNMYNEAVKEKYRFFSFGDATYII